VIAGIARHRRNQARKTFETQRNRGSRGTEGAEEKYLLAISSGPRKSVFIRGKVLIFRFSAPISFIRVVSGKPLPFPDVGDYARCRRLRRSLVQCHPFFSASPRLPGDLDDEGKLTLVRRLIREGLVLVLAP
jgi:hypothetical protein